MKVDATLSTLRSLSSTRNKLGASFSRLASGKKVSASSDPAGLAISEALKSQRRGLEVSNRNISYGQANLRTQEGQLSQTTERLQRLRELALQSANGSLSNNDRANLQTEFDQITQDVDASGLGIEAEGIATQEGAEDALEAIDNALDQVNSERASLGAESSALEFRRNANAIQAENLAAAESQISDVDYAEEVSELKKQAFLQEAQVKTLQAQLSSKKKTQSLLNNRLSD